MMQVEYRRREDMNSDSGKGLFICQCLTSVKVCSGGGCRLHGTHLQTTHPRARWLPIGQQSKPRLDVRQSRPWTTRRFGRAAESSSTSLDGNRAMQEEVGELLCVQVLVSLDLKARS